MSICPDQLHELIGYARGSTDVQDLRLQRAALKEVGCRRTFEEKVSGAKRDRPELTRLLDQIRGDDVVVVTRLDRLARSTRDLLVIAEKLKEAGAGLRLLAVPWADTTSPAGRMMLTVFAGIAEFERELIHQRTSSGRVAAKARRVRFGRPPKLTPDQITLGERLVGEGTAYAKLPSCLSATMLRSTTRYRLGRCHDSRRLTTQHSGIGHLMPIRPEHVFLHPIDWPQLSRHVRCVRAWGACEHCGRPHGQKVLHLGDGRWWDRSRQCCRDGRGRRVRRPNENILARGAWTPEVLACAHLNHDPSDSALHQLAALCQCCHMIHDGPEHRRRR